MLQILTGKFYGCDPIINTFECVNVIYSNLKIYQEVKFKNFKITPTGINSDINTYVVSFTYNMPKFGILCKTDESTIISQISDILGFSLNGYFESDINILQRLCRKSGQRNPYNHYPHEYLNGTLDMQRHIDHNQIEESILFVDKVLGLDRKCYNSIIHCLSAFRASIQFLDSNFNLAYTILVYCLESLVQKNDEYSPKWEDYPIHEAIEKFCDEKGLNKNLPELKNILLRESHLKLIYRFKKFILNHIDDDYYIEDAKNIKNPIKNIFIDHLINNIYKTRSKYVHELEPVFSTLANAQFCNYSEIVTQFDPYDIFITYKGLVRLVKKVIRNFIDSKEKIEEEKYDWKSYILKSSSGIVTARIAAQYEIESEINPNNVKRRFWDLIDFILSPEKHNININAVLEKAIKKIEQYPEEKRKILFSLVKLWRIAIKDELNESEISHKFFLEERYYDPYIIESLIIQAIYYNDSKFQELEIDKIELIFDNFLSKKYYLKYNYINNLAINCLCIRLANFYLSHEDYKNHQKWSKMAIYNFSGDYNKQKKLIEFMDKNEPFDVNSYLLSHI